MTERTITVRTVDAGDVTTPEPLWCVGHDGHQVGHRVDFFHRGQDLAVTFQGQEIGDAALVLAPFAPDPQPGVTVSLVGRTLNPGELFELAAVLDRHADQLRTLADRLSEVLAGGGQ
ncbi:DUF6907 domain-containing protein [Streptomyces sp. CRN 30]|uniref:DUF6907 domain-containing protein n=1 Tax=Streptomyces sp. CRN 30 TaxID=3075613 RepID=UPI002A81EDBB|nr:hypothetical protein [Streptomyces sp. CRN 30]